MFNKIVIIFIAVIVGFFVGRTSIPEFPYKIVHFGTGTKYGLYFSVGNEICKSVSREAGEFSKHGRQHGIRCTASGGGSSFDNLQQMGKGNYDFGISQDDVAIQYNSSSLSFKGEDSVEVTKVLNLYKENIYIMQRSGIELKSLKDLVNVSFNIGPNESALIGTAMNILKSQSMTIRDIKNIVQIDVVKAAKRICDGSLDAGIFVTAPMAVKALDILNNCDAKMYSFSKVELQNILSGKYPYSLSKETGHLNVWASLYVRDDIGRKTVREIVLSLKDSYSHTLGKHPMFINKGFSSLKPVENGVRIHRAIESLSF